MAQAAKRVLVLAGEFEPHFWIYHFTSHTGAGSASGTGASAA
jgi:hypothetical protein